jgi:hypothetical protein
LPPSLTAAGAVPIRKTGSRHAAPAAAASNGVRRELRRIGFPFSPEGVGHETVFSENVSGIVTRRQRLVKRCLQSASE